MNATATDPFALLDHVSASYEHEGQVVAAVEEVSLTVPQGAFVAVTGPSGCGKPTLLKLLAGLLRPTGGEVRVGGVPVRGPQKNVGMAFQNPILLPWRRTLDNVLLPLEIVEPHKRRFRGQPGGFAARANALLASVGIEGFGHRPPWP